MVGGSGCGFLYSSREKTCVSGDGAEEGDLSGGGFRGGRCQAMGFSAWISSSGTDGGGAAEGGGDGGGSIEWVRAFGGECGFACFGGMSASVSRRCGKKRGGFASYSAIGAGVENG